MYNLKNINAPKADVFLPLGLSNKPSAVGALFLNKMKRKDLTGIRFGKLNVIEYSHTGKDRHPYYLCKCDCGNVKIIKAKYLKNGDTKSCGCSYILSRKLTNFKHGEKYNRKCSTEYGTYLAIKQRCYNKNNPGYKYYGGRGIVMCDEWRNSFNKFLSDVGRKPFPKASIDRIDNNGNYEPGNCRWATKTEQNNNTSSNRAYTFNNKTLNIGQWANLYNIPRETLSYRLNNGMSIGDALTIPIKRISKL